MVLIHADCWVMMWQAQFDALRKFVNMHGHSRVPFKYSAAPSLGVWVDAQRRAYVGCYHAQFLRGPGSLECALCVLRACVCRVLSSLWVFWRCVYWHVCAECVRVLSVLTAWCA